MTRRGVATWHPQIDWRSGGIRLLTRTSLENADIHRYATPALSLLHRPGSTWPSCFFVIKKSFFAVIRTARANISSARLQNSYSNFKKLSIKSTWFHRHPDHSGQERLPIRSFRSTEPLHLVDGSEREVENNPINIKELICTKQKTAIGMRDCSPISSNFANS